MDTGEQIRVASGPDDNRGPTISGDLVAYESDPVGNDDSYISKFEFVPSPEPCDPFGGDADADEVCDMFDNCVGIWNPGQEDSDGDGIGDACDGP